MNKTTEESLKGEPKARAHLDEVIGDLRRHNEDLVKSATLSTQQELLEMGALIEKTIADMKALGEKGLDPQSSKKMQELVDGLQNKVAAQTALAKSWADNINDDPEKKKAVAAAAATLAKEAGRAGAAAKALIAAPKSKDKLDDFLENAGKTSKANKELVALAFESPDDELEVICFPFICLYPRR